MVAGGGAAGLAAAETLRQEGYGGSLVLLCGEPALPYDRPPLSKQILTGRWEHQRAVLRDRQHYADLGIRLLHARASGLDTGRRLVRLTGGGSLPFDGLIIATGVRPRRLAAGHELAGVQVLRESPEAAQLRSAFQAGARVVIVGGGFLGMEVAAAARSMELDVTVAEPLAQPMLRQVGPELGAAVAALHRGRGVRLRTGTGVTGLLGEGGRVTGVALSDGSSVPADCVLVAIGAVPATGWLRGSGLPLGDGVECDEYCRAAPGIYAAGDVASWVNPRYRRRMRVEHRMNATEQGTAAAVNLLRGDVAPFAPLPYFWTDQYEVKIQVHGVCPEDAAVSMAEGAIGDPRFAVLYHAGGRLTGVLGWNAPARILPYRKLLLGQEPSSPAGTLS